MEGRRAGEREGRNGGTGKKKGVKEERMKHCM